MSIETMKFTSQDIVKVKIQNKEVGQCQGQDPGQRSFSIHWQGQDPGQGSFSNTMSWPKDRPHSFTVNVTYCDLEV